MKAKAIIVPTITLVLITLVITGLLVLTNGATKDKIAQLQIEVPGGGTKRKCFRMAIPLRTGQLQLTVLM